MAFVPVPNVCQLELVFGFSGQVVEWVFHYAGDFDPPEQMLTDVATNACSQWQSAFIGITSNAMTLMKAKATDLSQQNAPGVEVAPTGSATGTKNEQALPTNTAAIVSLKTAYRGRSYRGRKYLCGLCEDQVNVNTLAANYKTALATAFDYFMFLDTSTGPVGLVVVSRYHNGAPRAVGVSTPVTNFIIQDTVGTQRRRLPGRGT